MKQYFAKLLPTPDEIKEGDRTMESNGNILPHTISKDEIEFAKSMGDKVVKMFICDRNINVGDEILTLEYGTTRKYDGFTDLCADEFKVVGEFSKYAIWVKDGDEFDEEDFNGSAFIKAPIGHRDDGIVFVKGPCGHFH